MIGKRRKYSLAIEIALLLSFSVQTSFSWSLFSNKPDPNGKSNVLVDQYNISYTVSNPAKNLEEDQGDLPLLEEEWWEIEKTTDFIFDAFPTSKFYLRFEDLDDSSIHSCYEYKVIDINLNNKMTHFGSFCYPAIVITGVRKCSTSALYNLFREHPQTINTGFKENCLFIDNGDRSIIQYFNSLPRNIENGQVLFDGCVDLYGNMKLRKMLRNPSTYYILLVRDYSDWIWSAYNYWCQTFFDKECNPGDHWTNSEIHIRSNHAFHDIVTGSMNGTLVPSPLLIEKPCVKAENMFTNYVDTLWASVPIKRTMIIASEELDVDPWKVWDRLSKAIGFVVPHPKIVEFTKVRYNTQNDMWSRGESSTVDIKKFTRGIYPVSKNQPLLPATRATLDKCWEADCVWVSLVTGYKYDACKSMIPDHETYITTQLQQQRASDSSRSKQIRVGQPSQENGATVRATLTQMRGYIDLVKNNFTNGGGGQSYSFLAAKEGECRENFQGASSRPQDRSRVGNHDASITNTDAGLFPPGVTNTVTSLFPKGVAPEFDTLPQRKPVAGVNSENKGNTGESKPVVSSAQLAQEMVKQQTLAASSGNIDSLKHLLESNNALLREFLSKVPAAPAAVTRTLHSDSDSDSDSENNEISDSFKNNRNSAIYSKSIRTRNGTNSNSRGLLASSTQVKVLPGLLLLSVSLEDRDYVKQILHFAGRFDRFIDVENVKASGKITLTHRPDFGWPELCLVDSTQDPVIVSTNPGNFQKIGEEGGLPVFGLIGNTVQCSDGIPRGFSKVMVFLRDSITSIWTQYQINNGYKTGLFGDDMAFFDWDRWEQSAVRMLQDTSNELSDAMWNMHQSRLIDQISENHKLICRLEDLKFSAMKIKKLRELLQYIAASRLVRSSTSPLAVSFESVTRQDLICSHILAKSNSTTKHKWQNKRGRSNIELAYASDDLLCKIRQLYKDSPLQLSSLQMGNIHTASCRSGHSTGSENSLQRKCVLRYARKIFLSDVKNHPIAMLIEPGLMTTNMRHLMEASTSVLTGSMNTNRFYFSVFRGEAFCGQRLGVIHAHPKDVTLRWLKSGKGGISLNNVGMKKCRRGMIRGFARGLLIVRDPFAYIWNLHSKQIGTEKMIAMANETDPLLLKLELLHLSFAYTSDKLRDYGIFQQLSTYLPKDKAYIVSYESLMVQKNYGGADAVTAVAGAHSQYNPSNYDSRYNVLRSILDFSNFPSNFTEKLECAYNFLEDSDDIKRVRVMHKFYLAHPDLICSMESNFRRHLNESIHRFTRLYEGIACPS